MTEAFITWFTVGFCLHCIGLCYALLGFVYYVSESECVRIIANGLGILNNVGVLVWIIFGFYKRWGFVSRVCAGDFLTED